MYHILVGTQRYDVFENIVYQNNKGDIVLENKGKASSSKHTRHIDIRYYFVTDYIEKYGLSLNWCPASDKIGYFMTKPTQGVTFKRFWDQLMGVTETHNSVPGNLKKYHEYQVSNYGQKSTRNEVPAHR